MYRFMADLFSYGKKGIKEFIRENQVAILYTLIFHVIVLIIMIFVKVEGLKNDQELGVLIDFEEKTIEEILEEEMVELPAKFLELIKEQRELASNRAVNVNAEDPFNQEISTEDYMKSLLDELEAGKDDDLIKEREKWKEILESQGYIEPQSEELDSDEKEYYGPTTITYEFKEEPLTRSKSFLAVPVYRCQGSGLVKVDAVVARDGTVSHAEVRKPIEGNDATCFAEAALEAVLTSRFRVAQNAPDRHKVLITYSFMAQ